MAKRWFDVATVPMGAQAPLDITETLAAFFFADAADGAPPARWISTTKKPKVSSKELLEKILDTLGHRVLLTDEEGFITGNEDGCVEYMGKQVIFKIISRDKEKMDAFMSWFEANSESQRKSAQAGHVYAFTSGPRGLRLQKIGKAGLPMCRENYDPAVVEQVDRLVADIASPAPSGRVSIMAGPPGTGKTFLVRHIVNQSGAMFVIVPSKMIENLGDPSFLPALIDTVEEEDGENVEKWPIVLILEDGDHAIVPRDGSNTSAVSAVLNLGDGILGSILDIRIVITTNAKKIEIDKAVTRPGRLSQHIDVGLLKREQATAILRRLCPSRTFELGAKDTSLAEVYAMAKDAGWTPPRDADRIGFSNEDQHGSPVRKM